MLALLVTLLSACSTANSCAEYVVAAHSCTEEAGGDPSSYDEETICGDWTAENEAAFGTWYQCQADAWSAADCSTSDGVQAAANEAAACPAA
ncbi:MAG: hypothetical protein ACK4YP_08470 [Myxococcota bacterium]